MLNRETVVAANLKGETAAAAFDGVAGKIFASVALPRVASASASDDHDRADGPELMVQIQGRWRDSGQIRSGRPLNHRSPSRKPAADVIIDAVWRVPEESVRTTLTVTKMSAYMSAGPRLVAPEV